MPAKHHPEETRLAEWLHLRLKLRSSGLRGPRSLCQGGPYLSLRRLRKLTESDFSSSKWIDRYVSSTEEGRDMVGVFPSLHFDSSKSDWRQASFGARFLPALVDAYKTTPHLITPYTTMLRSLLDSEYFAKFMRGELGRDLLRVHAERLTELDLARDGVRWLRFLS